MAYLFTFIVGIVFWSTGVAKTLNSNKFIQHLFKYKLLPFNTVVPVGIGFIGLECAWGMALLFNVFPQWVLPGSIILLVGLSVLTLWSTVSGRTEDCGCYGGLLVISPVQSILLNLGYSALLGIAWLFSTPDPQTQIWKWAITLFVLVSTTILAWLSRDQPLIDLSRLKIGNRWKRRWLKDNPHDLLKGTHFIVFLSEDCPHCKRWVPFLNVMSSQKDLPQALGIMSLPREELEAFKIEQRVKFPLVSMDKLLFGYMAEAFPTAILIEDGVVTGKWIGIIPETYLERIKEYYEQIFSKTQALL